MDLIQLRRIGELFVELENKRFPDFQDNRATAQARQIGTMSVYISDKDAKKIIKTLEQELEGLN